MEKGVEEQNMLEKYKTAMYSPVNLFAYLLVFVYVSSSA